MLQLSVYLFLFAVVMAVVEGSHFLSVLLVLELMTLSLFFVSCLSLGMGSSLCSISFSLLFLTFGVYEAANGLGLLVSRTRSSGADNLSSLFSLSF
uniref:NADH-ubiquinone oxidoreductase chain 4L n=1 Tax=Donax variegatus TaxID=1920007 RepID=A0A250E5W5_9BIVA|nr:NADH dehydrogenase subunit 4L [Donax variegatus]ATA66413.1 NADH dehydrogenase subunit 4L [Donax variegatus]